MKSYVNKNPYDYYEELEEKEKKIYEELYFDYKKPVNMSKVNIKEVLNRDCLLFEDFDYNLPQNLFVINHFHGKTLIGRKIRSILRIENKINAINCSMITAPMLLGILKSRKKQGRKITINFYPFTNDEKKAIFNELVDNRLYDIYYPYKYYDFHTKKEEKSPESGWSFNPDKKEYLGYGEIHLREFTSKYFKKMNMDNKLIYDPACSTGEFLSHFKKEHQRSHTIGHDLSKEMIDYAKDYVDEYCCCDAINSPIKPKTIDAIFIRFLNSEVVTTNMAYKIMKQLLLKVKKGGKVVLFGHTPVLIKKSWFEKHDLKTIICNGYSEKRNAIFQYYVFEVK